MNEPLYEPLPATNVSDIIHLFAGKTDLMVLTSAMQMEGYGRYSFICFDAFASFSSKGNQHYWNHQPIDIHDPFAFLNEKINAYKSKKIEDLPPFQGGAVGYFGYEASHYLEELPRVVDHIQLPDIYLNFYRTLISIDHATHQAWVIAPTKKKILEIKRILSGTPAVKSQNTGVCQNPTSSFTHEAYITAVNAIKEYILNGDIFQANLTQQLSTTPGDDTSPLDLYFKLTSINPAPFSAFLKLPNNGYIISASPERFIKVTDQQVETSPIKGTRRRSDNKDEDARLATELLSSEKDRAENVMIVDLMRNDISRVCASVNVEELCALKSFETVHHLVSRVTGKLKNNKNSIDLLQATFPPGSVTGAPKIRAMEIISELEQQARGPYCGCLGYLGFNGDMDTSVIIRSYFLNRFKRQDLGWDDRIFFSAGGAIVLDSNPEDEYQESLTKAQALIKALIP